jgi:hypothetical protein
MATLELDVVLFGDESPEDGAKFVAGSHAVIWEVLPDSGNCWPTICFTGSQTCIDAVARRYANLGKNVGNNVGKPPVGKGQKR